MKSGRRPLRVTRLYLASTISDMDERTAARIENGKAPFWAIVREAVEARAEA